MKYFYYSPSQHAMLVRNSTIAEMLKSQGSKTEVFNGKKFVKYTESSCNPSNFPDAIIVAKFAKGEKYQTKYNGILSNFTVE